MIVVITDKFQVEIDGYGNHQPYFWQEPELIEKGKYAGQMSKEGWRASGKHFTNLATAINYGVKNGYIKELPVPEGKESLMDYIGYLQDVYDMTEKLLSGVDTNS